MEQDTTKRILITGSDGFIGSHLKHYLKENKHEFNFEVYGTTYFKEPENNEIKLDVRKPSDFKKLWNFDFDYIIHTIGNMSINAPEQLIYQINVGGTKRIVEWGIKHNCKHFIYLSSIAVYGPLPIGQDRKEGSFFEYKTLMLYGKTKRDAEIAIKRSNIPYTILRLPAVLGEKDTQLSPAIISKVLKGELFICGKERNEKKISILVVDNLCSVITRLIQKGPFFDEFNCCCSRVSWTEFIKEYFKVLGQKYKVCRKSTLSALWHLNDKHYLLLTSFSKWGADFSSQKLKRQIGEFNIRSTWKKGVKKAVNGYIRKNYDKLVENNLIHKKLLAELNIKNINL